MSSLIPGIYARRIAWAGLALAALGTSAVLAWSLFSPWFNPAPLPDPNGYDDLVRAGGLVTDEPIIGSSTDPLRAYVEANRPALDLLRQGLERPCRVPLPGSITELSTLMDRAGAIRKAWRVLDSAARLARRDGDRAEAVRCYLDMVRLGHEAARGGLLHNDQMGNLFERMGIRGLMALRAGLTADEVRDLLDALRPLDGGREPIEVLLAREQGWFMAAHGMTARVALALNAATLDTLRKPAEDSVRSQRLQIQAQFQLLLADLAIRLHRERDGRFPESLAGLVPRFLAVVPDDPFAGRPLIYRPIESGYLLYSIGPNGEDDGGPPDPDSSTTHPGDDIAIETGPAAVPDAPPAGTQVEPEPPSAATIAPTSPDQS